MRLNKVDLLLLSDLFSSQKGLLIYTLYRRYKISPNVMFRIINKLVKNELILHENERVVISEEGKAYLKKNILFKRRFNKKAGDIFSSIPKKFLTDKIGIDDFYIPRIQDMKKISII